MTAGESPNIFITYKFKKHALGGDVYERMVVECVSGAFDVIPHAIVGGGGSLGSVLRSPALAWKLARASSAASRRCPVGIFSADAFLLPFRFPRAVIGIVHHVGASSNALFDTFESKMFSRLRKAHRVVVVSEYWRDYFRTLGFENLELIYNGFALTEYDISRHAIEDFKARYGLTGKPIIYLGNNGPLKGVQRTRAALQGIDAHFVSSGHAERASQGLVSLRLDRCDYLRLLAASDIVTTMSEFDEGWCRTAHEGMLTKTPVIGSGRGGMRELLLGGQQVITEDPRELRQAVAAYLDDPYKRAAAGQQGFDYAQTFSFERFQAAWRACIGRAFRAPATGSSPAVVVPELL
jgi:glycosyltransferase involved in cell wall biosynthesis